MKRKTVDRIDLNLLLVFDALMQERSVTRAAQRLAITPSTVSHALGRLRHSLKDELFVRGPGEMRPTPRATRMAASTTKALTELRAALVPAEFDPQSAVHTFRLRMTDYAATFLLDKLAKTLRARAPNVDMQVSMDDLRDAWGLLERQEADLLIGMVAPPPERFDSEVLYDDKAAVIMAKGHSLARRPITMEDYAAAKHVFIPVDGIGTGSIDRLLQRKGLIRRHVITVNQFSLVPSILRDTDYIMTGPARLGEACRTRYDLCVSACPFEFPALITRAVWHSQFGAHAANRWMRQLLHEITAQLVEPTRETEATRKGRAAVRR